MLAVAKSTGTMETNLSLDPDHIKIPRLQIHPAVC
jgi:hypothetical protein